jgi:hypothetical protein
MAVITTESKSSRSLVAAYIERLGLEILGRKVWVGTYLYGNTLTDGEITMKLGGGIRLDDLPMVIREMKKLRDS